MDIETLDGIKIYILPDNAKCLASDGHLYPFELSDCPLGRDKCVPEVCDHYAEIWTAEVIGLK